MTNMAAGYFQEAVVLPGAFPTDIFEKTSGIPFCCQVLPEHNGSLARGSRAEKIFCWALRFWKMLDAFADFEHAVRGGTLDSRHIDFLIRLHCGSEWKRDIKSSLDGAREHRKLVRKGEVSRCIVVDIIPPGVSVGKTIDKIGELLKQHACNCSPCAHFLRPLLF